MKLGRPASQSSEPPRGRRGESGDAGDGHSKVGSDRMAWVKKVALPMDMASGETGGGVREGNAGNTIVMATGMRMRETGEG